MNELPDDLWQAEHSRIQSTQDLYVNDAGEEIGSSLFTTDESVLLVGLGLLAIAYSSVVTVLLAATAGLSITLILRRLKGGMFHRGATNGVSHVTVTEDNGYGS